ncbi:hypothetical protein [Kribbella sp. NPDC051770]|uniref:hypothetical protein n=1 Tax=Kribbella sp. NPDC051770 TaxID=3155413 RepID=UPI00343A1F05
MDRLVTRVLAVRRLVTRAPTVTRVPAGGMARLTVVERLVELGLWVGLRLVRMAPGRRVLERVRLRGRRLEEWVPGSVPMAE